MTIQTTEALISPEALRQFRALLDGAIDTYQRNTGENAWQLIVALADQHHSARAFTEVLKEWFAQHEAKRGDH